MSPIFMSTILGIAITVLTLTQVVPSISAGLSSQSISNGLDRETMLVQQILRYQATEGSYPVNIAALISANYWTASANDNGFGGSYTFTVDAAKNQVEVSTTIADSAARARYINAFKRKYTPVDLGGGAVKTTFVLPGANSSNAISNANMIIVAATAPSAASNGYWYDTSGTLPVLRVSDGTNWTASADPVQGGSPVLTPSSANIVASAAALPVTANTGDIRYVYDAAVGTMSTMYYYNGSWTSAGTGTNAQIITKLASAGVLLGHVSNAFSYDFSVGLSAMFANTFGATTINPAQVTWSLSGALPTGMSFNTTTGVLSGTPTILTTAAGTTLTVVATHNGQSGSQSYTLKVGPNFLYATKIANGNYQTCAITTAGGAKCWGVNWWGNLGDGTYSDNYPVTVSGLASGVIDIASGNGHSCALKNTGAVVCWGYNSAGQLGDGSTTNRPSPVAVVGLSSGVTAIGANENHTCAVKNTGAVVCWGVNGLGELGDGSTTNRSSPVTVSGIASGATKVSVGYNFTCAVVSGGVKCWGSDYGGKLGDGAPINGTSLTPVTVTGLSGVSDVSLGVHQACALLSAGGVKCWGVNWYAGLGDGSGADQSTPVSVTGITNAIQLSVGNYGGCATLSNNTLKCWGNNEAGQLGNGNFESSAPTTVGGASAYNSVFMSPSGQICAITTSGAIKCAGATLIPWQGKNSTFTDILDGAWP